MPRRFFVIIALALGALCWGLGGYPLLEPDEGRNAQVAREMKRGGDWILPHLDGLPYLDKPAPYFAAVAASFSLFGETERAARLPSLLFTLGTVFLLWRLGRMMGPPGTGEIAALAYATMPLVLAYSRTVILDPALAFLETLSLMAAWRGFSGSRAGPSFALAWAAMGAGAVTKGPVAIVVPLLIVLAFGAATRRPLKPFFSVAAWPWLLVTALPWFVAVSLRRVDFPGYALVYESLERVGTTTHGRAQVWWFFVPVALLSSFPWIGAAAAAAFLAWQRRRRLREPAAAAPVFIAAWALVPLVFFSLSQSKLAGYYLPALPATALAAGLLLAGSRQDETFRRAAAAGATICGAALVVVAVAMLALPIGRLASLTESEHAAIPSLVLALAAACVLAGLASWLGGRRNAPWLTAAALALPVAATPLVAGRFLDALGRGLSSRDLAAAIVARAAGARIVGVAAFPTSLIYYLDRPVLLSSATGREITSNYVASRYAEFLRLPGSPLRAADFWRTALDSCSEPSVFVVARGTAAAQELAGRLPLIGTGGARGRFAAYGPCRPQSVAEARP